jgi:acyl carrier protein phosphodiesterase
VNYLAHAYLSFGNKEILLGNTISDFVKGKQQFTYPSAIHKGIRLHRMIDEFTDTHAATKEAKEFFRKDYRLYSGAFVDVVYDHFLATDTNEFSSENDLFDFAQQTYRQLGTQQQYMPQQFGQMFFYMHTQNWLYGYRTINGIKQSFGGLVRRSKYLQESFIAAQILETHYEDLKEYYHLFWKEAKPFALQRLNELLAD